MALPGWNVSEPLHVAKKIYDIASAYRDAPNEIRAFTSHLSIFCFNLTSLNESLSALTVDPSKSSPHTLASYNKCVHHCEEFLAQIIQDKPTFQQKCRWLLKNKEKAVALGKEIDSLNLSITVLLVSDIHKRVRQNSQGVAPGQVYNGQGPQATPLRPADLLLISSPERDKSGERDYPQASCAVVLHDAEEIDPLTPRSPSQIGYIQTQSPLNKHRPEFSPGNVFGSRRQSSLMELRSQETGTRRDSLLYDCTIDAQMTMLDPVGATISYSKSPIQKKPSVKTVHRIEFLKDNDGSLRFLSITTTPSSTSRLYQSLSLDPRTIPHSEHPIAYKSQNPFVVKFQQPHQLMLERRSGSVSAASNMSMRTPSLRNSPGTIDSTNSGQDTLDIGSPLLSPGAYRVTKESDYPRYEFKIKDDYEKFQGYIMGRVLLVNLAVDSIFYKSSTESKPRQQSERQYLRLWDNKGDQTIMFYANLIDKYVEHNMKYFLKSTHEEKPYTLTIKVNIRSPEVAPLAISRNWSWKSQRSSASSSTLTPETEYLADDPPEALKALDSIIIKFTESDGPSSFLKEAKFGKPKSKSPATP